MNESRKQIARKLLSEIAPSPTTKYHYSTKTGKTVTKQLGREPGGRERPASYFKNWNDPQRN